MVLLKYRRRPSCLGGVLVNGLVGAGIFQQVQLKRYLSTSFIVEPPGDVIPLKCSRTNKSNQPNGLSHRL